MNERLRGPACERGEADREDEERDEHLDEGEAGAGTLLGHARTVSAMQSATVIATPRASSLRVAGPHDARTPPVAMATGGVRDAAARAQYVAQLSMKVLFSGRSVPIDAVALVTAHESY